MECEICKKEAMKNKVVCSDHCAEVRDRLFDLIDRYTPTNGCDNCWGDLHDGCSEQCMKEFHEARIFATDLWGLVRLIFLPTSAKADTNRKV